MNTERITKAMAEAMDAKLARVEHVQPEELAGYDLIGFGSGIYGYKHHKKLFELIEREPSMEKKAFVFSTAGSFREQHYTLIKEKLAKKGCTVIGEFACLGQFAGTLKLNLTLNDPLSLIEEK